MNKISDSTDITIPLRNLLSIVFGVSVGVATYFHINERISMLEHDQIMIARDVEGNYKWRVDWEKSGLLPADIIQNEKIIMLEEQLREIKNIIKDKE